MSWTDEQRLRLRERMAYLKEFSAGWGDDSSSLPITETTRRVADDLLDVAEAEGLRFTWPTPTSSGGIEVEWSVGEERCERFLELEAMPEGTISYLYVDPEGTDHEATLTGVNDPRLTALIRLFIAGQVPDAGVLS